MHAVHSGAKIDRTAPGIRDEGFTLKYTPSKIKVSSLLHSSAGLLHASLGISVSPAFSLQTRNYHASSLHRLMQPFNCARASYGKRFVSIAVTDQPNLYWNCLSLFSDARQFPEQLSLEDLHGSYREASLPARAIPNQSR